MAARGAGTAVGANAAFREHLQKLGWSEGTNLRIDLALGGGRAN
jgi:hypothetical protein